MNDPRCLIADDHPALTSAVSAYVSENGFEVVAHAVEDRSCGSHTIWLARSD